jgi:hypothetical protein
MIAVPPLSNNTLRMPDRAQLHAYLFRQAKKDKKFLQLAVKKPV